MFLPSPIYEKLSLETLIPNPLHIQLDVLRLDKMHPVLGGNKYFKLKNNLEIARKVGNHTILTFGGAYSNHIAACALAGKLEGFKTIGIIRGQPSDNLSPTLKKALLNGMKLHFVSRTDYKLKTEPGFIAQLHELFGDFYLIPEGGSNIPGVEGCKEMVSIADNIYDVIAVSCGTGASMAGLILGARHDQKILGISVLKDGGSVANNILKWLKEIDHDKIPEWQVNSDFHCGGYAKTNAQLERFVQNWNLKTNIPIEPVYTGKMFLGLTNLISDQAFPAHIKILAIHTGGLQYLDLEFES